VLAGGAIANEMGGHSPAPSAGFWVNDPPPDGTKVRTTCDMSTRQTLPVTHKGNPISFMRDKVGWHHHVPNEGEIDGILTELETVS
jgi:hypothetical protein